MIKSLFEARLHHKLMILAAVTTGAVVLFLFSIPSEVNSSALITHVSGASNYHCETVDDGSVYCDIHSFRYGDFRIEFPADTLSSDTGGITIDIINNHHYYGVFVDGAILPPDAGIAMVLPRLSGRIGTKVCIRDVEKTNITDPDGPCFNDEGQAIVFLPSMQGEQKFSLREDTAGKIEYNVNQAIISGVGNGIVIFDANERPIANNDHCFADEDTTAECFVLVNDIDEDADVLSLESVSSAYYGRVYISGTRIIYEAEENWSGNDFFTYTVTDGLETSEALVTVSVLPVNDSPSLISDTISILEDNQKIINVVHNDMDVDSDRLSLECIKVSRPKHGISWVEDGLVGYKPHANYHGYDSFEYSAVDDKGARSEAKVDVIVVAVNDVPTVRDMTLRTRENTKIRGKVVGFDVDNDELTYFISMHAGNGHLEMDRDGYFEYTPNKDYFGEDIFAFQATDGEVVSKFGLVNIIISEVCDICLIS
jgi:hypothetical protein